MHRGIQKAELLGWLAHIRYLNGLCSDPLLQGIMLSRYGGKLQEPVSITHVMYSVDFDIDLCVPKLPALASSYRAARLGKGHPLHVAICYTALCRAVQIPARLIRGFELAKPGVDLTRRWCRLGPKARKLCHNFTKGGMEQQAALDLASESEKSGDCDLEEDVMRSFMSVWVECFDKSLGLWVSVDPFGPIATTQPADLWLHPARHWMCAADDHLRGGDYCELLDVADRYWPQNDEYRRARADTVSWDHKSVWWNTSLKRSSGEIHELGQKALPQAAENKKASPKQMKAAAQVRKWLCPKARKSKAERQGLTGFPSLEPFEANLRNLQNFLQKRGVLPWLKSDDHSERVLGRFVDNLRIDFGEAVPPVVPLADIPEDPEPRGPVGQACTVQLSHVRATLELARCRSSSERRSLLRRMQVEFHPDKNVDSANVRPMFDFVQSMWEKEFGKNMTNMTKSSGAAVS
ncbi:Transgelin-3 [Durusdinium trenchii]|uniref:Transgelin-3 n=1 Tax=Durusdinium trenchii TaxID=1381693 RepID=A0ABP0MBU8_9DINO